MSFYDPTTTLRETVERPSLAEISRAVFDFLRTRNDVVLFGAYAVNAYVDPPRMTEDVDVMSTDAGYFAHAVRDFLAERFYIAVRVRDLASGQGFRVYQLRQQKTRHLVDVRQVKVLPPSRLVQGVSVVLPPELFVLKLESYVARKRKPKGITDKVDIVRMLQAFPEFPDRGPVARLLKDEPKEVHDALEEILGEGYERDDDTW
jgi:Nucleotidyl transferase AbiEii toxin, Type IV TA system